MVDICDDFSSIGALVVIRTSTLPTRSSFRTSSVIAPSNSPLLTWVLNKVPSPGAGIQPYWSRSVKASARVMGQACSAQVLTMATICSVVYA